MAKRIIGAVIGMIASRIIFEIVYASIRWDNTASTFTTFLLVGGLLGAYIADGYKPKPKIDRDPAKW